MRSDHSLVVVVALAGMLALGGGAARAQFSPVYNGSFEKLAADGVAPDGWKAEGNEAIVQTLTREQDPQRGFMAKLSCTKFAGGMHDSHVMLAQYGRVGVEKDKWYRVSLWTRCADLPAAVAQVQLRNNVAWPPLLASSLVLSDAWQRSEFVFQAKQDLKPADGRFAVYFGGTGTLWVSDVAIEPTTEPKSEWFPAIPMPASGNALPNSSFECGGSGWGCAAALYFGYQANVFRLLGEQDRTQAFDGKASWKITLSDAAPQMLYVDYSPAMARPVRDLIFSHMGWVQVQPGQPCVFSAYMKCSRPGGRARLSLTGPKDSDWGGEAPLGEQWKRIEVSCTPKGDYLVGSAVFGLPEKEQGEQTFWIDAVQFERGTVATSYHPRSAVEGAVTTGVPGNIFTDPAKGLQFNLIAHNASDQPQTLQGSLSATDFWDRTVWHEDVKMTVDPGQTVEKPYTALARRRGFFRLTWAPQGEPEQSLRCAVIDLYTEKDSILGFNHAFPQDFMFQIAQEGGFRWWRDWSDEWKTVQPTRDAPFDFTKVDIQTNRVLKAAGDLLVLIPGSTTLWDSSAEPGCQYPEARLPKDMDLYAAHVRATVKHFEGRTSVFEIVNEPGLNLLSVDDYVKLLKVAYKAAKEADPNCTVIGGQAGGPSGPWVDRFIELGGLNNCDVTNYHIYPGRARAESEDAGLAARWDQMNKLGEAKPIWITEFGVYADDTPHTLPVTTGDDATDSTLRPDELTASQDIVQLATVMFANGVRKIFFHMGLGQGPHESSLDNVFFDYGGVPRKMYPAMATLARLLGPDFQFVRRWTKPAGVYAYEFRSDGRTVVILWTRDANPPPLDVPQGLQALDLMGNPLPGPVVPGTIPIYLVSQ
jgi:hypothetical protein